MLLSFILLAVFILCILSILLNSALSDAQPAFIPPPSAFFLAFAQAASYLVAP
jgi:hypothetical protein